MHIIYSKKDYEYALNRKLASLKDCDFPFLDRVYARLFLFQDRTYYDMLRDMEDKINFINDILAEGKEILTLEPFTWQWMRDASLISLSNYKPDIDDEEIKWKLFFKEALKIFKKCCQVNFKDI